MTFHAGEDVVVACTCERRPCRHEGMQGTITGQVGDDTFMVRVTRATRDAEIGERLVFDGEELRPLG